VIEPLLNESPDPFLPATAATSQLEGGAGVDRSQAGHPDREAPGASSVTAPRTTSLSGRPAL
jgi:hypothetical protein